MFLSSVKLSLTYGCLSVLSSCSKDFWALPWDETDLVGDDRELFRADCIFLILFWVVSSA